MTKIALLNIGSELLVGRTVNTNASKMALMLRAKGFHLETTAVCHDTEEDIRYWIDELLGRHEVVLITGGLGPTKDDITKKVLQERFGGEMQVHQPTLDAISAFLSSRHRPLLEQNRQQAFVPSSCEVIMNAYGTAPGMAFREEGKLVVSMPGVPMEMTHLMQEHIVPMMERDFPVIEMHTRIIRTVGIPESRIADKMEGIEQRMPVGLQIAYLPSYEGTKIELRMKGNDASAIIEEIEAAQRIIARTFAKYVYSLEDKSPSTLLKEYMFKEGKTMATAESCTGGAIAALMVQHSGISSYFKGGVVAYMREVKESVLGVKPETIDTHGIVSEQVAKEMARGAREKLGSDFAVSITGIAEAPEGVPVEEMPQCWIGFSDRRGEQAFFFRLFRQRKQNIAIATQASVIYALRCLQGKELREEY